MYRTFEYRLYPFHDQLPCLYHHLAELDSLWNHALGRRVDAWRKEHRTETYLDQQSQLERWREFDSEGLGKISFGVAMDGLQRLDLAFRAFFRRNKAGERSGFPRFRSARNPTSSFTFYPQRNPVVPGRGRTLRLKVPRIGEIPIRVHRPLPENGVVKSVTLRIQADGWYADIAVELPDPAPPLPMPPEHPVGIDLGVNPVATLSTGERIAPFPLIRESERRLHRAQKKLSRKKRGSGRYERQRRKVERCYARLRRQRRWRNHQLSTEWVREWDLVAFEDLDASELVEGNRLAKGMAEAGWGSLRRMTAYKAAARSQRCVMVPTTGTTQNCSDCGRGADPPMTLSDRVYRCPCGLTMDRDLNAARNIVNRGMKLVEDEVRRNTSELTRVESGPPPRRVGRRAYQRRRVGSVKRETVAQPMAEERRGPPDCSSGEPES